MDFAAIFRSAGIPFVEVGQWRSRVRPGTFAPEGVLIHHTASSGFDATLKVVRDGRPDLLGPLCNVFVANGKCYLISAGRANHAGTGSPQALANLRAGRPPKGTAHQLGYTDDPHLVGNGLLVGFEVLSPGKPSVLLPQEDWVVAAKAAAAILRAIKRPTVARVIGHAEWTSRKIDPQFGRGPDAHINMDRFRQAVRPYLEVAKAAPTGTPAWFHRNLYIGLAGPDVAEMQKRLHLAADGDFGPQTKAAVVAVQKRAGQVANGTVRPDTAKVIG